MEINQNRLRFVHCEHLFNNIDEIKDYVLGNAIDRPALYAEPMVFKYGNEKEPDIVLAIGSIGNGEYRGANRVYFIDFTQVEKDVAKAIDIAGASAEELKRIREVVTNITTASGFNEQGEYLPEINDRILSKATSLSVADKILSDYIKDLEKKHTLAEKETKSVKVNLDKQDTGVTVSADVKLGTKIFNGRFLENMIVEQGDGLFSNVDLEYLKDESKLLLTINGDRQKEIALPEESHVVSGKYDEVTENLVLKLNRKIDNGEVKTDEILISMGKLISEWGVLGNASETPIVLTREELKSKEQVHDGLYDFKDVLKADVRIVDNASMPTNILKKDSSGRFLYVDGSASNITYVDGMNKMSVQEALDSKLNKVEFSKHSNNIITLKEDGLFASVDVEYNSAKNQLVFSRTSPDGKIVEKEIDLMSFDFMKKVYYDAVTEEIVIVYVINGKTNELRIPMQIVVNSFDVDNSDTNVTLTKITNTPGVDKLKADVNISKNDENILEEVGHGLMVRGTADNIKFDKNNSVHDVLTLLNGADDVNGSIRNLVRLEKNERVNADNALTSNLNNEVKRAKEAETANKAYIESNNRDIKFLSGKVATNIENIKNLGTTSDNLNNTLQETNRTVANHETRISKSEKDIVFLSGSVDTNISDIRDLNTGLTDTNEHLADAVNNLNSVTDRVKANEDNITNLDTTLQRTNDTLNETISDLNLVSEKANNNETEINSAKERLSLAESDIDNLKADVEANTNKIAANKTDISTINSTLRASGTTLDSEIKRLDRVETQANTNKDDISQLKARMKASGETFSSEIKRLDNVEVQANTNKDAISAINSTLKASGTTLDGEIKRLDRVEVQANTNKDAISAINSTLKASGTTLDNEIKRLTSVETQSKTNKSDISAINSKLESSGVTLGNTIDRVGVLETKSTESKNSINAINTKLESSGVTLGNTIKTLEEVKVLSNANKSNLDILTNRVSDDEKELKTLKETVNDNITNISTNKANISLNKKEIDSLTSDLATLTTNVSDIKIVKRADNSLAYDLLIGGDEMPHGTIIIPKDKFLQNVSYDPVSKKLTFVFITDDNVNKIIEIEVDDLVDTYTAGNGLDLAANEFSVRRSSDSEEYLQVNKDGIKVVGIDAKLANVLNTIEIAKTWVSDNFITNAKLNEHTLSQKEWVTQQIENSRQEIGNNFVTNEKLDVHTNDQQAWTKQEIKNAKQEISDGFISNSELDERIKLEQGNVDTKLANERIWAEGQFVNNTELETHTKEQQSWAKETFIDETELANKEKEITDAVASKYMTIENSNAETEKTKTWVSANHPDNLELTNALNDLKAEIAKDYVDNTEMENHISTVKTWVSNQKYATEAKLTEGLAAERTYTDGKISDERTYVDDKFTTEREYVDGKFTSEREFNETKFVDNDELASKGYLTEHQDISSLATKDEVNTGLSTLETRITENYVSNSAIPGHLETVKTWVSSQNYATEAKLTEGLASERTYADGKIADERVYVDGKFASEREFNEAKFVDNDELAAKGYLTEHQDISSLATKDEVNTNLLKKENIISTEDSNTVTMTAQSNETGNKVVKASVKIDSKSSGENLIKSTENGLFASMDVAYNPTNGELTITKNGASVVHHLAQNSLVKDANYNLVDGTLDLTIKLEDGSEKIEKVPIANVSADNKASSPITIEIDNSTAGTQKISAKLAISTDNNNALNPNSDSLFVSKDLKDHVGTYRKNTTDGQVILNTISNEIDELSKHNVDYSSDIARLDASINSLNVKTDVTNGNVSSLERRADGVDTSIDEINKKLADLGKVELVGYQYIGVATTKTVPMVTDQNICYLATSEGKYDNFKAGFALGFGETAIFKFDAKKKEWTKEDIGLASKQGYTKLYDKLFPLTTSFSCSPTIIDKRATPKTDVTLKWDATIESNKVNVNDYNPHTITYDAKTIQLKNGTYAEKATGITKTTIFNFKLGGVSLSAKITFVEPRFFGIVPVDFVPNEEKVKALPKTLTLLDGKSYRTGKLTLVKQKMCYAYPQTYGKLTSIKDGNGYEILSSFTPYDKITINGVKYYIYVKSDSTSIVDGEYNFI